MVSDVPADESALAGLMVRYQGGDTRAFEELYEVLSPQLGRYLRSLARDASLADDLLQETFLQIHRARHSYMPSRPVRPWAYAIARHVFLMSRRSRYRRAKHETTAVVELPDAPIPPEVADLGDRDEVRRALARVADDHREALVLHHILGLSFREVGRVLGISEGAAKVRAHRGIVTMRRILGQEGATGA